jgi:hypothetical protein
LGEAGSASEVAVVRPRVDNHRRPHHLVQIVCAFALVQVVEDDEVLRCSTPKPRAA